LKNKVKELGQIYTPRHIVEDMLDLLCYNGSAILQKHIIDNSCGNGAFLTIIVERYIKSYKDEYGNLDGIENELAKYIHGIEIDEYEYFQCIDELNCLTLSQGIGEVDWDISNCDTMECNDYDGKMDFVVANPPYVRIHNLGENFEKVRDYKFSKSGMTDLYIVFYELGFNMLNGNGKLCYITPNSFYSSGAGQDFRDFIFSQKNLYEIVDLGHYQPFNATTYTTICAFDNSKKFDYVHYSIYTKEGKIQF